MSERNGEYEPKRQLSAEEVGQCVAELRKWLERPKAPRKGLDTIKAFVDSLRVEKSEAGTVYLRSRKGSWNKNDLTERKTRSELAKYHLPMYVPHNLWRPGKDAIYRIEKSERGSDSYVLVFEPPSGPVSLLRDDDYSTLRARIQFTDFDEYSAATVVQHTNLTSKAVIGALMDKNVAVSFYIQDPMYPTPDHLGDLLWDRVTSIIPDFVHHELGSLEVWLYNTPASFHAIWVERKFIAVGWYTYIDLMGHRPMPGMRAPCDIMEDDGKAKYELPLGIVGFTNPIVVADAGSREYEMLKKMVQDFIVTVHDVSPNGAAYAISRGRVKRAMGDH